MVLWGLRAQGLLWVLGMREAEELLVLELRVVLAGDSWFSGFGWQM